jgi:outer membrane protein OmpA-like peptidoglycan-associated protein
MKKSFLILACGIFLLSGCATPGKDTAIGAGGGAAVGAGVGALIGSASGNAGRGALIGALAGAAVGGTIGNMLDAQAQKLAKVAETRRTKEGILVKMKGDILFDTAQATLKDDAVNQIDQVGDIIAQYPSDKIVVTGHTDNAGKAGYNQQLSEERANAVRAELLSRDVPESSITAIGMGESQPIASNDTAAGKSKNRRVELKITIPQNSTN